MARNLVRHLLVAALVPLPEEHEGGVERPVLRACVQSVLSSDTGGGGCTCGSVTGCSVLKDGWLWNPNSDTKRDGGKLSGRSQSQA